MKNGRKSNGNQSPRSVTESEDELANTNASNFTIALGKFLESDLKRDYNLFRLCLDDDRVNTLTNLGYPLDYVKYTILENEANYCVTGYYLLGTD